MSTEGGRHHAATMARFSNATVTDEKTSIQARRRKHPARACRPRASMQVEHEYFRRGAWTYIAALDVHHAGSSVVARRSTPSSPLIVWSSLWGGRPRLRRVSRPAFFSHSVTVGSRPSGAPDFIGRGQAHRQSPLLSSFPSSPEARGFPSTGITRLPRYFCPSPTPRWCEILSDPAHRSRPCHHPGPLLLTADYLLGMLCSVPRWPNPCRWLSVWRAPAPGSSGLARPSPLPRRVGIHIASFEACSSFTRVTACQLARPPFRGLCRKVPARPVSQPIRSPAIESNHQLFEWVLPPLVIRLFRAYAEAPRGVNPALHSLGLRSPVTAAAGPFA